MDEKRYHMIAGATLEHCFSQLEEAYDAGALDELELDEGILTIKAMSGRTFLISKHAPSLQLWYASPVSGGLHFRFEETEQHWALPDGRAFYDILCEELAAEGVKVVL